MFSMLFGRRMDKINSPIFTTEYVWYRPRDGPPYGEFRRGKHTNRRRL